MLSARNPARRWPGTADRPSPRTAPVRCCESMRAMEAAASNGDNRRLRGRCEYMVDHGREPHSPFRAVSTLRRSSFEIPITYIMCMGLFYPISFFVVVFVDRLCHEYWDKKAFYFVDGLYALSVRSHRC